MAQTDPVGRQLLDRVTSGDYSVPCGRETTYSLGGFFVPDDPELVSFPPTHATIRFGAYTPSRLKKRLCARSGHPASRLAKQFSALMMPDVVHDDDGYGIGFSGKVMKEQDWCLRCGAVVSERELATNDEA
jgi:hypothetical protein